MRNEAYRALVDQAIESKGFRTKKEIANLVGRDQSWVSRITTGEFKVTPSPEDLSLIGEAIGISPAILLAALGYDVIEAGSLSALSLDHRLNEVTQEWPHLNPEERNWIYDIMDTSRKRREVLERVRAVSEEADAEYSVR